MQPDYDVIGNLIRINRLDVGDLKLLTVGFRFTDQRNEKWTARFNCFKFDGGPAVEAATRTFCAAFDSVRVPEDRRVVVASAISSGDTVASPNSPAASLGRSLAQNRSWEWQPWLLKKQPHKSLSSLTTAPNRDCAVQGAYFAKPIKGPRGVVLIVDDFCTRGATLADIARAIRESNPGWNVKAATLAKNESAEYWGGQLTNEHIPEVLDSVWLGGRG